MVQTPAMNAVVEVLKSEGVDTAFGCPGANVLPLYKAMEQVGGIEHLTVRHEEGATHMADGWSRTTGKVGVAIGTSGPAGTNMVTGLYTAIADSIPIVCITGQAVSPKLHQEAFQAVDIVDIVRPVTKWAVQLKEAAQAPWIFREAFRIAQEGRPGPVLVDIPVDIAQQVIEYDATIDAPLTINSVEPYQPRVQRALDMLLAARRPLLLAGGGVITSEASAEFNELAEYLNIPVQVTLMGKGTIAEDHRLYSGMTGIQTSQRYGNAALLESDLVLAVGARFGDRHTGASIDTYRGERQFIHVDIEPTQIGKVFEPDLGIVSDARLFVRAMLDLAKRRGAGREPGAWTERIGELKRTMERREDFDSTPIKAPRVYKEINDVFDAQSDAYFVTAIGLYQIWGGQHHKAFKPRHYQVCGQAGPLGWEIPAAVGVKKALKNDAPNTDVVGIVGDYSFQYTVEELAVAAQYNVPFVLVMLNNEYLGLIRQAEIPFDMNYQVDIHYDDYGSDNVKIMEAYGCSGRRVFDPAEVRESLEWARKESRRTSRPVLVEIMIEREANTPHGPNIDAVKEFEPLPDPAA